MVWLLALLVLAGASVNAQTITKTFGSGVNTFSIDFVTIGNAGNAADDTGFGAVSYIYNLGKFEISREQILKANAAGGLGITLSDLSSFGGNGLKRPATWISWNEAARFVNYLNTSQGYQAAYNFPTSGVNDNITLWGTGQYSGSNQYRHRDAYYFLPSADEWYKGAYGNSSGSWYNFSNGSDNTPIASSGGPDGAVYGAQSGPADVDNAGVQSPYGTIAQGGNVYEWNESAYDGTNNSATEDREFRGGAWNSGIDNLEASSTRTNFAPASGDNGFNGIGFRVASVPEPSSLSLLALGGAVVALCRRKRA